ncbi:MAG: hypothetical protein CMG04_01915 [Candidatus Marinimicrobia bacterium]|nr:hypothetical protein [Candidatus Neomarinimicrobiota bacterium]
MKNLLIILLFIGLVFWSCEDEEASSDVGNDSIIGSWNFTATEYDSTCTGDGELVGQGTMVFNETDVIVTNIFSFNYFCSLYNGTLIDDTTCVYELFLFNDTLTLSNIHEICEEDDDLTLTNTGCSQTSTNSYTFNESLLIIYSTEYGVSNYECSEMMGTYSESDSTCTDADTVNITINGNNATFNDFYTDYYYPEYSYCNVIELVRQ